MRKKFLNYSQCLLLQPFCKLVLSGQLEKLPEWILKIKSIVRIALCWSRLLDDPLKDLQALPNLMHLRLYNAYGGEQLHIKCGGFQKLNNLGVQNLGGLNRLITHEGALPLLVTLRIGPCSLASIIWNASNICNLKKSRLNLCLVCNQTKALILGRSSMFLLFVFGIGF